MGLITLILAGIEKDGKGNPIGCIRLDNGEFVPKKKVAKLKKVPPMSISYNGGIPAVQIPYSKEIKKANVAVLKEKDYSANSKYGDMYNIEICRLK